MSINTILIIFVVYLFAMIIQRVCGFGMGIIAVMILPYFTGAHTHAAAYTNILSAISASYIAWKFRENVRWKLTIPISGSDGKSRCCWKRISLVSGMCLPAAVSSRRRSPLSVTRHSGRRAAG